MEGSQPGPSSADETERFVLLLSLRWLLLCVPPLPSLNFVSAERTVEALGQLSLPSLPEKPHQEVPRLHTTLDKTV